MLLALKEGSATGRTADAVKDLIPQTQIPFDYWEFDIKYVWVAGKRKSMQVLTVLDVNSGFVA